MAQLADFISRIFSSGRTQGLSGGAEMVVDPDPAAAFYVARLRRHLAEGDYVADPALLWSTKSYGDRRGGLRAHIQAERGEGIASFTDVLVVVSQADARRAATAVGEAWTERAARVLGESFTEFCNADRFELLYGTRPLRFRLVADGGKEMLSHSIGLEAGEYVTGLLPNLYVGPAARSRPVLAVHLNLPGVWEGYREVGRLYSDQIVFTLGRHWLDNYAHPALREPGIYRLQQYPDGSLVHVISPELQDRYFVRSDQTEAGPSVLTIAEVTGRPVAFLVLAVVESMTVELPPVERAAVERAAKLEKPAASRPAAAAEASVSAALADIPEPGVARPPADPTIPPARPAVLMPTLSAPGAGLSNKQKTIIPDAFDTRILTLHERGALLQKVHFSNFMEGYDVYLGPKAQIATSGASGQPRATIQVRFGRVSLVAREAGVTVDNKALEPGQPFVLKGAVAIEVDGVRVEYRDLSGVKADGWPYLGELRRPGAGTYLDFGTVFQVGRDRRSKVRLPDEPHNDNIAWLPSVGGGATIRSRTGDIPKSRFYTDSIMVASTHAEMDLSGEPLLRSLARHCFTYVRRGAEIVALFPREGAGGRHEVSLQPNDELLVGNCLFQASYPPPVNPATASMPPQVVPRFTADDLASIADAVKPALRAFLTVDPVSPAGLGGTGPSPRPVRESRPGLSKSKRSATDDASSVPTPARGAPPPPVRLDPSDLASGALDSGATDVMDPADVMDAMDAPAPKAAKPGKGLKSSRNSIVDAVVDVPGRPAVAPSPPPRPSAAPAPAAATVDPPNGPPRRVSIPAAAPPAAPAPAAVISPKPPPPPMLLDDADLEPVRSVEEKQWQQELGRPARLVQVGWSVHGEFIVGNHIGVDMVVPEVKSFAEQAFMTLDYVRVYARGKKGRVELIQEGEASVIVGGAKVRSVESLRDVRIEIIRRDASLEPDFDITLNFTEGAGLPDPRAQLLEIDVSDRLVAGLFTTGFPLRSERKIRLGPIHATMLFDGESARVTDYLASYRTGASGFVPFFVREVGKSWRTIPEDGTPVVLRPGDSLLAGTNVYRFEVG